MRAGRAKAEEQGCRACGSRFNVEAAHIISRARCRPGPAEDPRNIIGLCGHMGCGAHRSFDEGVLDILPLLSLDEQSYIVGLVGIAEAYRRATGAREVAA
jgi:hypothetical protein